MRLVIVWLLPVPGGPKSTKSRPRVAASIAATCDESASRGSRNRPAGTRASSPSGPSIGAIAPARLTKRLTTGLCISASACSPSCFHMRYLANEKVESATSSVSSNPSTLRKDVRTCAQIRRTSIPASSVTLFGSMSGISTPKSWRTISRKVGLIRAGSSVPLMVKPSARIDRRSSETGRSSSGARYGPGRTAARVADARAVHETNPNTRKRVLAPVSSSEVRTARYSSIRRDARSSPTACATISPRCSDSRATASRSITIASRRPRVAPTPCPSSLGAADGSTMDAGAGTIRNSLPIARRSSAAAASGQ